MTQSVSSEGVQYTDREIAIAACKAVVEEHRTAAAVIAECNQVISEAEQRKASAVERARVSVVRAGAAMKAIRQDLSAVSGASYQDVATADAEQVVADLERRAEAYAAAADFLG